MLSLTYYLTIILFYLSLLIPLNASQALRRLITFLFFSYLPTFPLSHFQSLRSQTFHRICSRRTPRVPYHSSKCNQCDNNQCNQTRNERDIYPISELLQPTFHKPPGQWCTNGKTDSNPYEYRFEQQPEYLIYFCSIYFSYTNLFGSSAHNIE